MARLQDVTRTSNYPNMTNNFWFPTSTFYHTFPFHASDLSCRETISKSSKTRVGICWDPALWESMTSMACPKRETRSAEHILSSNLKEQHIVSVILVRRWCVIWSTHTYIYILVYYIYIYTLYFIYVYLNSIRPWIPSIIRALVQKCQKGINCRWSVHHHWSFPDQTWPRNICKQHHCRLFQIPSALCIAILATTTALFLLKKNIEKLRPGFSLTIIGHRYIIL